MKVLIISQYFPPDQVGASRRVKILSKILSKNNKVTILTSSPHYPSFKTNIKWYKPFQIQYEGNMKIVRIFTPSIDMKTAKGRILSYLYFSLFSLFGFIAVGRNDVVWGTSPNVFVYLPIRLYSLIFRVKTILNVDDLWPTAPIELGFLKNRFFIGIALKFALMSLNDVDAITPISDYLTKIVKKFSYKTIIQTVYVGIEKERLKKFRKKDSNFSNKKSIIFMYSGKLGPAYDFELLINSFNKWSLGKKDVKLVIKGTGYKKNQIKKLIDQAKNNKIELHTQYLSDEKYDLFINKADCFIIPMKNNFVSKTAIPTKLLEYLATGKDIILIGSGQPAKVLSEAGLGQICSYDKQSIHRAFDKALLKNLYNERGQIYLENNFSEKEIAKQISKLFNNL